MHLQRSTHRSVGDGNDETQQEAELRFCWSCLYSDTRRRNRTAWIALWSTCRDSSRGLLAWPWSTSTVVRCLYVHHAISSQLMF